MQDLMIFFYISSANYSVASFRSARRAGLQTTLIQFLLFSRLPTTMSTLYLLRAKFMRSFILVVSVSSLNETVRCLLSTRLPNILGEFRNLISSLSCVWILCYETYSGMKSDTAAHRIIIDYSGSTYFRRKMPSRQRQMVLKGIKSKFYACFFNFCLESISFYSPASSSLRATPAAVMPARQGRKLVSLWKKIKGCYYSNISQARSEPLAPVEKFQIILTVFFSKGTEVPPEVTSIIGLEPSFH